MGNPFRRRARCLSVLLAAGAASPCLGQAAKETNEQVQAWVSLNTTSRLSDRWGVVGDFHLRRNDFVEDPSFYLLRVGAHRFVTGSLAVTLGYAHNWVAPATEGGPWTNENRIYQQIQSSATIGKVRLLHRLRNEQRWQDEVVNDTLTGRTKFSDRVRYLVSVQVPLSARPSLPSLVLSDEIAIQFGSAIVLNTFDQNRLFAGIKKSLSRDWSFDLGYMLVYQQKSTGYQYDLNHTVRCFFYWTPDFRQAKSSHDPASSEE
jgi:hypothetical protein